ncbi:MAG: DUF2933 domain-containing protein [Dethiobacter sp.]|jgi:hypothetical protein|nr:DUF2933 domain-containing protein [Dethiobacter sp.]
MARFLPYLMIILCPLLHIVMMRGMHGRKGHCEKKGEVDN